MLEAERVPQAKALETLEERASKGSSGEAPCFRFER